MFSVYSTHQTPENCAIRGMVHVYYTIYCVLQMQVTKNARFCAGYHLFHLQDKYHISIYLTSGIYYRRISQYHTHTLKYSFLLLFIVVCNKQQLRKSYLQVKCARMKVPTHTRQVHLYVT